jgi:phosphohistidine phosphatase
VPSVIVANGAHKYVLIAAKEPESGTNDDNNDNDPSETYFVTSKRGAHYHVNAAEPVIERLETSGYSNIRVLGGGRIFLDDETKKISIFGYSYGFGRADHQISQMIIEADNRYKNYDVSWSNDGY